jgi:hypothetical protein
MYVGTLHQPAEPVHYDVSLPEAGLDWQRVGPLFERYSIKLVGTVDGHWADAYRRVATTNPRLSRFRLDPASAAISFTCRSTDGPAEVMTVLKILEGFVEQVNREACVPTARLEPGPAPRPAPASAGRATK